MSEIDTERAGLLQRFKDAMFMKLIRPENVAKSDWREMAREDILERILDEVREAETAHTAEDVAAEAVDIANFAFMLWDNATRAGWWGR